MCATGTHLGDTVSGWEVRADNMKTYANGLLRLESHGPASHVGSMATGSFFTISDPPDEQEQPALETVAGVVCFLVFDMLYDVMCCPVCDGF